jgi:hypothetical protein
MSLSAAGTTTVSDIEIAGMQERLEGRNVGIRR